MRAGGQPQARLVADGAMAAAMGLRDDRCGVLSENHFRRVTYWQGEEDKSHRHLEDRRARLRGVPAGGSQTVLHLQSTHPPKVHGALARDGRLQRPVSLVLLIVARSSARLLPVRPGRRITSRVLRRRSM